MEAHADNREAHEYGLPFYRKPINMGFPTKADNGKAVISIVIDKKNTFLKADMSMTYSHVIFKN